MTWIRTAILMLGSLTWSAVSESSSAWEITLIDTLVTRNSVILLADIAEIDGIDDAGIKANLETIVVAPGPTPSLAREFSSSDLRTLVAQRGLDMSQGRFTGAARVTITFDDSATVTRAKPILRRGIPTAQMQREKEQVCQVNATTRVSSQATRPRQGRSAETGQPMVVAARDLSKGRLIQEKDVTVVYISEQELPPNAISCLEDVVGQEVTCAVRVDEPLADHMLKKPVLVRNRDLVELGVCSGGVVVSTYAVAQNDGGLGDTVAVIPVDNKKHRLYAQVVDVRKVRVLAGGFGGTAQAQ